jgi:hypothetical protein
MAWTDPTDEVVSNVWTAAKVNVIYADLRLTPTGLVTTKGDIAAATAANAMARLAAGSDYGGLTYLSSKSNGITTTPPKAVVKIGGYSETANTVTETDILSYSIPANALGSTGTVKVTCFFSYLNNSGSSKNLQIRGYLSSTGFLFASAATITSSANYYGGYFTFTITNQSATNAQHFIYDWNMSGTGYSGVGWSTTAFAIDTTSAATVKYSIQHSGAASTVAFRQQYATIEIIKSGDIA